MKRMIVAVLLASLVPARPASADPEKKCEFNTSTGTLRCVVIARTAPALTVSLGRDVPFVWSRMPLQIEEEISRGRGCIRDNNGVTEIGQGYIVSVVNTRTGEQISLRYVCQYPTDPPPEPPAPTPTFDEFREAISRAVTVPGSLNPRVEIGGLTGLDTWLWCNDPGPVAATVTLRGWTAVGQVTLTEIDWHFDGPKTIDRSTTTCGSEARPAATWMPQTKGTYQLTTSATWAGSWTLTYNGDPFGTNPLGPFTATAPAVTYPVTEYRGVLVG